MLPLRPPGNHATPDYPTRQKLCTEDGLLRRAVAVIAAAALAGCSGGGTTPTAQGGAVTDGTDASTTGGGQVDGTKRPTVSPDPVALPGSMPAVITVDKPEPCAVPLELDGEIMAIEEPEPIVVEPDAEPVELMGEMVVIEEPDPIEVEPEAEPVTLAGDVEPIEPPEPITPILLGRPNIVLPPPLPNQDS